MESTASRISTDLIGASFLCRWTRW
ncbi:hypothetical protein LINPERPRIM_LOCUS43029 [Linum perenne]